MSDALQVDPEEFKSRLHEAIAHYNDAIEELTANRPVIDPGAFGEAFASHGRGVADAVEHVHNQTLRRLRGRIAHYESMLALADSVAAAEADTAGRFTGHV